MIYTCDGITGLGSGFREKGQFISLKNAIIMPYNICLTITDSPTHKQYHTGQNQRKLLKGIIPAWELRKLTNKNIHTYKYHINFSKFFKMLILISYLIDTYQVLILAPTRLKGIKENIQDILKSFNKFCKCVYPTCQELCERNLLNFIFTCQENTVEREQIRKEADRTVFSSSITQDPSERARNCTKKLI